MSFCRWGNEQLPDFYIFPTWNREGEDVLALYINNPHQELTIRQVRHLKEILEDYLKQQANRKRGGK